MLQPLQFLGDDLGLEQQGLDPRPGRLVEWLGDDGRPLTVLESLASDAPVVHPVAPAVDEHRRAAVPAPGVAATEQNPLGLTPGALGALHVQPKALLDERERVGVDEGGGRPLRQGDPLVLGPGSHDALTPGVPRRVPGGLPVHLDAAALGPARVDGVEQDAADAGLAPPG
jgi:hypothetical protein